ncbi:uncharacterized protein LOC127874772 isoform X2 [Dreissena polymorpha]|uniref:Uncharacterized protein n=1 Tax=Dreissena polymorpha TaxID=45954 RepID=A0A9D4L4L0_DREPO|nr:uncharacterized protein LOC127874772 isoform X2 [Dreissena polymorpha]XP_052275339.1 uncharacterized protein LOC127874772 isoform X2 [Dreissena polymorpha]XP_052275340.1 uncharacterized protein LOC127874772 isoform X2 [Dreissena polymorpha]KAH3851496.1 hypothetical protein DPMN_093978 [Dreissena polymorpha]
MSIKLEDHKTAPSGKYAYFHMPRDVYNMLLGYCKLVRQGNADEDTAGYRPVFGTVDEDACHSAINKWLKAAWKNSGMEDKYPDFKMKLTNNRKQQKKASSTRSATALNPEPGQEYVPVLSDAASATLAPELPTTTVKELPLVPSDAAPAPALVLSTTTSKELPVVPSHATLPPRPGATHRQGATRYPPWAVTRRTCPHPGATHHQGATRGPPWAVTRRPGPTGTDSHGDQPGRLPGRTNWRCLLSAQAQQASSDSDSEQPVSFVFRKRSRRFSFESEDDDLTTTTSSRATTGTRNRVSADETREISEVFADNITQLDCVERSCTY